MQRMELGFQHPYLCPHTPAWLLMSVSSVLFYLSLSVVPKTILFTSQRHHLFLKPDLLEGRQGLWHAWPLQGPAQRPTHAPPHSALSLDSKWRRLWGKDVGMLTLSEVVEGLSCLSTALESLNFITVAITG